MFLLTYPLLMGGLAAFILLLVIVICLFVTNDNLQKDRDRMALEVENLQDYIKVHDKAGWNSRYMPSWNRSYLMNTRQFSRNNLWNSENTTPINRDEEGEAKTW